MRDYFVWGTGFDKRSVCGGNGLHGGSLHERAFFKNETVVYDGDCIAVRLG